MLQGFQECHFSVVYNSVNKVHAVAQNLSPSFVFIFKFIMNEDAEELGISEDEKGNVG